DPTRKGFKRHASCNRQEHSTRCATSWQIWNIAVTIATRRAQMPTEIFKSPAVSSHQQGVPTVSSSADIAYWTQSEISANDCPHGGRNQACRSAGAVELTFLGNAFECLAGALDAVLVIVAVRGKQFHDPIGAVGGHMADRPGCKID